MSANELTEPAETGLLDPSQYGDFGGAGEADAETVPYFQLLQALSDAEKKEAYGEGSLLLMPDEIVVASGKGAVLEAACVYQWKSWMMVRSKDDTTDEYWMAEETFDPENIIALRAADWPDKKTQEVKHGGRYEDYADGQVDDRNNPLQFIFQSAYHFALVILGGEAEGLGGVLTCMKSTVKTGRQHFNGIKRRAGRASKALPCFSHATKVILKTEPVPEGKGKGTFWCLDLKTGAETEKDNWPAYAEAYKSASEGYQTKALELTEKAAQ